MADEYDFFADGGGRNGGYDEYDGDEGIRGKRGKPKPKAAPAVRPETRTTTYRAGVGSGPARRSRTAAILACVTGLLAVAFGVASAVHEAAPAFVDPDGKVPGRFIALACALMIAATLILVVVAKTSLPRRNRRHRVASAGIVTLVLACLLLAFDVVAGVLFPEGLIKPNLHDEAPVESAEAMRFGIERVTGACEPGWNELDVRMYPGVEGASVCASTRVAYVTFDSSAAAKLYGKPLQSTIGGLLEQHTDDPNARGDWRLLSGERWIAFGPQESMTMLEREWGGVLTTVEADQQNGDGKGAQS